MRLALTCLFLLASLPAGAAPIVADHSAVAQWEALPPESFAAVRASCRIFYGHTSHGSQLVTGLQMLAAEDAALYALPALAEFGSDLGHNGDLSWVAPTRSYLDQHPDCSVVVWSWCGGCSDNTEAGIAAYLAAMSQLELDYPAVRFVYMTGHLDGSGPEGILYRNNAQIRAYCQAEDKLLFDFADIESWDPAGVDYPEGCLSPMAVVNDQGGKVLTWQAKDLITNQDIGLVAPQRLNPGPLATRITFFAPVCLIFFFVLVAAINVVRQVPVHPMHYLFVAAGFFAFHLLLAYLVDHLDVHLAFAVAAVTSVVLVTSYLTAALGERFPAAVAVVGQLFFLVLFSYSFFLEGSTGLTVAVGSVLTLAVLMKVTVHIDWPRFFAGEVEAA